MPILPAIRAAFAAAALTAALATHAALAAALATCSAHAAADVQLPLLEMLLHR